MAGPHQDNGVPVAPLATPKPPVQNQVSPGHPSAAYNPNLNIPPPTVDTNQVNNQPGTGQTIGPAGGPPPPPLDIQSNQKPGVYGSENIGSRITLFAIQDSWVQVESANGELLITRILYVGDSYRVPDRPGLTLITGNAGGLKIIVDDIEVPPLGPLGAVRRGVLLDPESLLGLGASDLE